MIAKIIMWLDAVAVCLFNNKNIYKEYKRKLKEWESYKFKEDLKLANEYYKQ